MQHNPDPNYTKIQIPQGMFKTPNIAFNKIRSKAYIFIIIVSILIFSTAAILFLFSRKADPNIIQQPENNIIPSVAITTTAVPTTSAQNDLLLPSDHQDNKPTNAAEGQNIKSFTVETREENKYEGWVWRDYELLLPESWNIVEENYMDEPPETSLKFVRNDNSFFTIVQGFADGGRCIYSDEEKFDGAYTEFVDYEQIEKDGYIWRLSQTKDSSLQTHVLCDFADNNYLSGNINALGIDKIQLNSQQAFEEFLTMLKNISFKE